MSSSSGKYLGLTANLFLIFTIFWSLCMMLPAINKFAKANNNKEMLDLNPKKNAHDVYAYMDKTTPEGRIELKKIYNFQDFVFPMAYGPFILFTLLFFHRNIQNWKKLKWICVLIPIIMVTCDYMENFSILSVLQNYPGKKPIASWIGMFTALKWIMGISSVIILITILWISKSRK